MSHDPKYDAPEHAPDCDECNLPVDEDDMAPSCGAHRLHIHCREWFRCRECALVWDEAIA